MATNPFNALVVLGPTASGKTRLAVQLAAALNGEIISADSRQVYRGLDLGSGKDLGEYEVNGVPVPYHLIDIVDLSTEFSVFDLQKRAFEVVEALRAKGRLPVIAGGTGLYLEAALRKYRMIEAPESPELRAELEPLTDVQLEARLRSLKERLHNTTDFGSRPRVIRAIEIAECERTREPVPAPDIRPLVLGTYWPRDVLRERIRRRLKERFDAGMLDEVRALHERGVAWQRLEQLGLEYRFIAEHLQAANPRFNDLFQRLCSAIGQFAKRQETWFRRMEKNGTEIHWIPRAGLEFARRVVERHFGAPSDG